MNRSAQTRGPFSQARQEHDARRSYYLPDSFARVEQEKPIYVIGTRGAGKTTFLKALTWSERLTNTSLQRQLVQRDGELFAGHYIGVYLKLPKSQLYVCDRWIPERESELQLYSDLVGLYLGLSWSELMCDGLAGLLEAGAADVDLGTEAAVVLELCEEYGSAAFRQHLDPGRIRTIRSAARAFREIRRTLERRAQALRPIEAIVEEFPVGRLTEVAQFVATCLLRLMPPQDDPPWSFRVCIDEAESMTARQKVVMNSIVRTAEWPLIPVVAWVSLSAWANVTDSSLTIGKADVEDVPLDNLPDSEFRRFVQGVATVRMQDSVGDESEVDLVRILGRLDINRLLEEIIGRSTARRGRELLDRAKRNEECAYFKDSRSEAPPIYQTYLVERLNLSVPEEGTPAWETRAQHSAEIRKKMVAAYMSICRELGTKPWYASADMVVQMSDGCVRDFLWQMHELWTIQGVSADRFLAQRIPDERQDEALKRASEQKMARIAGLVITEPRRAERLVDGLAALTAELQRPRKELAESGAAHLVSPEPGRWVLPAVPGRHTAPDTDDEGLPWEYRLVVDAGEAGYLRVESADHAPWRFRVHTSLAAEYGFSYRGAQYDVRLEQKDLSDLCEAVTLDERRRVVAALYRRLRGADLSLLDAPAND